MGKCVSEKQMCHILRLANLNKGNKFHLGHKHTLETKKKIGLSNKGEKNGIWKGDKVSYIGLHRWVKRNKPKLEFCERCKIQKSYDLANISGNYKRDINDFEWLCRSCHMQEDGRLLNNLKQGQRRIKSNIA